MYQKQRRHKKLQNLGKSKALLNVISTIDKLIVEVRNEVAQLRPSQEYHERILQGASITYSKERTAMSKKHASLPAAEIQRMMQSMDSHRVLNTAMKQRDVENKKMVVLQNRLTVLNQRAAWYKRLQDDSNNFKSTYAMNHTLESLGATDPDLREMLTLELHEEQQRMYNQNSALIRTEQAIGMVEGEGPVFESEDIIDPDVEKRIENVYAEFTENHGVLHLPAVLDSSTSIDIQETEESEEKECDGDERHHLVKLHMMNEFITLPTDRSLFV